MTIDLYINEANDYAQDIGAPIYHPHVSVIHYDEVGEIRHTLNRISCYGIFMQEEFPEGLTYGIGTYHEGDGSLMAYSPGQICGKLDDGTRRQYHGWVLLFDNELIQGSLIEQKLNDYQFFSYHSNEALILTPEEKDVLSQLMANLRRELETQSQSFGHNEIIRNYILLVLDYCNRFYYRQFKEMTAADSDILSRFQQVLTDYYTRGMQKTNGLPSVKSYITTGCNGIDLPSAMETLRAVFSIERLAVVGGGNINGSMLDLGLIDEVSMMYGYGIDGRGGMAAAFDGRPMDRKPVRLTFKSVEEQDGIVWIRYQVNNK